MIELGEGKEIVEERGKAALNLLRPTPETYVFSRKDKIRPRKNHGARSALSVYFAARYFWNYYQLPEMKQWLDAVATYWRPQMSSWMPMEGTSQGIATLMSATCYALAENDRSFLSPLYHENVSVFGEKNVPYDKSFNFLVFKDPKGCDRRYLELERTGKRLQRRRLPRCPDAALTRKFPTQLDERRRPQKTA